MSSSRATCDVALLTSFLKVSVNEFKGEDEGFEVFSTLWPSIDVFSYESVGNLIVFNKKQVDLQ